MKTGVGKLSDVKVISKIATTMNAKMGIQFTKTIANSQAEAYSTGTKVNWGETLFDAAVNAGVAGIYEKFGTNGVKSVSGKLTNLYDARALAKNEKMLKKVIEDGGFDAVDAVDDIVLNIRQEVVKSTIENGTKKVGGKVVKGSYTTIIEEIKKRLVPNTN